MRLLSITAQKPDSTGSGVYLTELVKGFEKRGVPQAVIAGVEINGRIDLPEKVRRFPVYFETAELPFPVTGMSDEMPYTSTRYCDMTEEMTAQFTAAFRRKLEEALEEFHPDVILCHHLYFVTALARDVCRDIPVYGLSHGSDLRQVKKNPWQREYLYKWIPELDGIFALHEEQSQEICRLYGCGGQKVKVIGTGYNSSIFFREKKGEAKGGKTELHLLFAGKISEKKGVKSLLRSLEYLTGNGTGRRVKLVLAGGYSTAEEYQDIQALAESCSCQIEFTGRILQKELAHYMNQSDIFVLPSFYEGLPLTVVEALACGMKVVCTDLPGIRPWLDAHIPGNGTVFVRPPEMVNEDEPVEDSLPAFEKRLARAILQAQDAPLPDRSAVEQLSWDGLCGRLEAYLGH